MPATRGIKEPCYKHVFSVEGECVCRNCRQDVEKSKDGKKSSASTPHSFEKKIASNSSTKTTKKLSPNVVIERLSNEALKYFDDVLGYSSESEKEVHEATKSHSLPDSDVEEAHSSSIVEELPAKNDRPKIGFNRGGKFKLIDLPTYEEVYGDGDGESDYYIETSEACVQTDYSQKPRQSPLIMEQNLRKKVEKLKMDIAKRHLVIGVLKRNITRKRKEKVVKEKQNDEVRKRVLDFLNSFGKQEIYDSLQCDDGGKISSQSMPLSLESNMSVDEVIRTVSAVFPKEMDSVEPIHEDAVVPLVGVPFNIFLNKSKYDTISMFVENEESLGEAQVLSQ